jgi:hypothetical protein
MAISTAIKGIPGADTVVYVEGNMDGRAIASA